MRMNLILEILDVPGQLVSILNPIGELGANVVTIVHKREIKAEEGITKGKSRQKKVKLLFK